MILKLIPALVSVLMLLTGCAQLDSQRAFSKDHLIISPDGKIVVQVFSTEKGALNYNIRYQESLVLLNSDLGLMLQGDAFLSELVIQDVSESRLVQDDYSLLHGKQRDIHYAANERVFSVRNGRQNAMEVIFRVADDGVAFKYRILGKGHEPLHFVEERTQFVFPRGSRAWLQPVAIAQTGYANTNPSYEENYLMDIAADSAPVSTAGWVFPALFRTGETWVAITEAGMDGSFHASRLKTDATAGSYSIGLPMEAEVFTGRRLLAAGTSELETPWRIIAIGGLADLVESTLGTDLADPAIKPMDFVKPGFVAWSWAMLKDDATRYDTQREFIDYAAQMHWPYVLIDALWDTQIGKQRIAELADYAASKDVGLILWYNSAGDWNTTPQTPKNALIDRRIRLQEFAWLKEIGIKGLKVDFFAGDGQSMMAYYQDLARDAADFDLMLNFHGSSLPRGLHRTYPNLLTMEAVKGFEFITFSQDAADAAPSHMAMLPFTRNLFDPMDFTPTVFSKIEGIDRRTTDGYELALSVLFLSGWQHIVEIPSGMAAVPAYVKNILSELPVSWDETRFVDGYPGKYAAIARRKGSQWYVAGINGENKIASMSLDLAFISGVGEVITDGAGTDQLTKYSINPARNVQINVKPLGGFLMKF